MHQLAALRPYVTAGVAVVGAGLIAVTPVVSDEVANEAAALQHRAVDLVVSDVINPIQTWLDILPTLVNSLEQTYSKWSEIPFPLVQQVLANWLSYVNLDVVDQQNGINPLIEFYTGGGPGSSYPGGEFAYYLQSAWDALQAGNIEQAINFDLTQAFWAGPVATYGLPNLPTTDIPGFVAQNFATMVQQIPNLLEGLGIPLEFGIPEAPVTAIGTSLQSAYDAMQAGDLLGALGSVANIPGQTVYNLLFNPTGTGNLVGYPAGIVNSLLGYYFPHWATLIVAPPGQGLEGPVAPGAPNIAEGGSLMVQFRDFVDQLTTGWLSPQVIVDNLLYAVQYNLGGFTAGNFAAAASTGSALSTALVNATDLGSLSGLSVLPADVATMLGALGGDAAAAFNPAALLGMLPF